MVNSRPANVAPHWCLTRELPALPDGAYRQDLAWGVLRFTFTSSLSACGNHCADRSPQPTIWAVPELLRPRQPWPACPLTRMVPSVSRVHSWAECDAHGSTRTGLPGVVESLVSDRHAPRMLIWPVLKAGGVAGARVAARAAVEVRPAAVTATAQVASTLVKREPSMGFLSVRSVRLRTESS